MSMFCKIDILLLLIKIELSKKMSVFVTIYCKIVC